MIATSDCRSVVAPNLISHSHITICRDTVEVGWNLLGGDADVETERVGNIEKPLYFCDMFF